MKGIYKMKSNSNRLCRSMIYTVLDKVNSVSNSLQIDISIMNQQIPSLKQTQTRASSTKYKADGSRNQNVKLTIKPN